MSHPNHARCGVIVAISSAAVLALAAPARADDHVEVPNPDRRTLVYDDGFILQSDWALARLYPRLSLSVDGRGTVGAGVSQVRDGATAGGDGQQELEPRVVLRRGLFELGGSAFGFLDMKVGVELDGRGTYGDPRLPNATAIRVGMPNAWLGAEAGPALNVMAGIQPTPFSLERRTDPDDLVSLEPSLASQLGVPFPRALGGTIWGVWLHEQLGYDVMGIAATGTTMPTSFSEHGAAGRVYWRPLALGRRPWDRLEVGISGRWTVKDGKSADLPRDDVTTGNGFALFSRRFTDAEGRTEIILPSGAQRGAALEVRAPIVHGLTLTGELYVFDDDTREAVESVAASTTQRLGSLRGTSWYAEATYFVDPVKRQDPTHHDVPYRLSRALDPGQYPHPKRRDAAGVRSAIDVLTTLSFSLRGGRADAHYYPVRDGAAGAVGVADAKSPGGPVDVWEIGGSASVWATRIFRLSASWQSYYAPDAGSALNRAELAGQAAGLTDTRWMHELTLRARLSL